MSTSIAPPAPTPRPSLLLALAISMASLSLPAQSVEQDEENEEETVVLDTLDVSAKGVTVGAAGLEAGAGFRSRNAEFGLLGDRDIRDTPLSISVINSDMIRNTQATGLSDLLKYLPSTQMQARGGMEIGRPQTRGFQGGVVSNSHLDGFNVAITTAYPMEQVERLEVINGLSGALYGPAAPAGDFKLVHKRPTATPLQHVRLGFADDSRLLGHVDLSDTLGFFGYRLNLLNEQGDSYSGKSDTQRSLVDLALDFHLSPATVLEVNASHYEYEAWGLPNQFSYGDNRRLPHAPDPEDSGLGQGFTGAYLETNTGTLRLRHDFNEDWKMVAGVSRQIADRDMYNGTNRLDNDRGDYTTLVNASQAASRFIVTSDQLRFNGKLQSGPFSHDLVLGTTGFDWDIYGVENPPRQANQILGTANIDSPRNFPEIDLFHTDDRYRSGTTEYRTVTLGDTIGYGRWSLMAMFSKTWIQSRSYDRNSQRTNDSSDDGINPTYSISYKPRDDMTFYVSYAESLEVGDTAPTGALNEGETLSPYESEQWEAGFKWRARGIDLAAAIFRIERPFAYLDNGVFSEQGTQVNRGLELSANGEILPGLSVYGGATWLDPRLRDTAREDTSDKRIVSVPKIQANLLFEYDVPRLPGLVLITNLHHTGKRAANQTNTQWVGAYSTFDIGTRYTHKVMGRNVVWRADLYNLTDRHYWASIFANSVDGSATSNGAYLGAPREFRASVSFDL